MIIESLKRKIYNLLISLTNSNIFNPFNHNFVNLKLSKQKVHNIFIQSFIGTEEKAKE